MKDYIQNFLIVSVAYVTAYSLTLGFIFPLQKLFIDFVPIAIGLVFLPHGVRVLTFHFHGWKGIFYLIPADLLMTHLAASSGVPLNFTLAIVSIAACYLGYAFGAMITDHSRSSLHVSKWKFFLIVGFFSSIANGVALAITLGSVDHLQTSLGYVVGDMAGMMVTFFALMMMFRMARLIHEAEG